MRPIPGIYKELTMKMLIRAGPHQGFNGVAKNLFDTNSGTAGAFAIAALG